MESQPVDSKIGQMSLDDDTPAPNVPVYKKSKSSKKGRQLLEAVKEYVITGKIEEERSTFAKIQQLLTKADADPNTTDSPHGRTCLHYIAQYGLNRSLQIATMLLSAGASANIVDSNGDTPLLLAIYSDTENLGLIKKLVAADGVNVDRRSKDGRSCIYFAVSQSRPETVRILLEAEASPNSANSTGVTPLMNAVTYDDDKISKKRTEIARQLIAAGADVNAVDSKDLTSLHRACNTGNLEDVDLLLSNGADLTALDRDGCDALFFAAKKNLNVKLVRRLIEAGLDVNYVNVKSVDDDPFIPRSVLHVAVMSNNLDILRCLLEQGANPNQKDEPPLCAAARRGYLDAMKLLLEYGADVNCLDSKGHTPLELVSVQNRLFFKPECVQLLMEAGAKLRNVLSELVSDSPVDDIPIDDDEDDEGMKMEFVYDQHTDCFRFQPVNNNKFKDAKCKLEKAECIIRSRLLYESQNPLLPDPLEHDNMGGSVKLCEYYEACKAEISLLKDSPLHESISYYDVLTTHKDFYKRVRDDFVLKTFQWKNFEKRFPVYAEDLWELSEKVKNLHKIWKKSVEKLSQLLGLDSNEHYRAIYNTLNRLNDGDLQSLAKVGS